MQQEAMPPDRRRCYVCLGEFDSKDGMWSGYDYGLQRYQIWRLVWTCNTCAERLRK